MVEWIVFPGSLCHLLCFVGILRSLIQCGTSGSAVTIPAGFWRPSPPKDDDHGSIRMYHDHTYSMARPSTGRDQKSPPDVQEVVDGQFPPHMLQSLAELRSSDHLCDVELEAEGSTMKAHRVVLAASIPYFRAMFAGSFKEATQRKITLSDISASALRQLIEYVYTSRIVISTENVQNLLFAASILQMDAVSHHCQRYMSQWLTPTNCLSLRQFAEQHNCGKLLSSTDDFAVEHFSEVRQLSEFRSIPFSHLRDLIRRSDLNVASEQEVFDTVVSWVEGEEGAEGRQEHLPELLSFVRLNQLPPAFLKETVVKHPLIRCNHSCMEQVALAMVDLVTEIRSGGAVNASMTSSWMDESAGCSKESGEEYAAAGMEVDGAKKQPPSDVSCLRSLSPAGPRIRARKSIAGVIFCVGGRGTAGDPFRSVEAYDWRRNRWFTIAEMTAQRRHVGVVSAHGKLYAIGGHDGSHHLQSAECYDPEERQWKMLSPMKTCRRGIAVGALEGAIYAVGGLDDAACFQTVERYDIESNTWTNVQKMNTQRGGVGVAALGKFLFAVGGNDGTSSLDSCERYDPHLDKWRMVSKMGNRRAGAGVCVLDSLLYAIGGFDDNAPLNTCERYDPDSDSWTQLANMSCARGGVGVASMGGLVYAIGGHDGNRYLNSVEAYDPVLNQWRPVFNIKECRAGAGVAWADVRVAELLTSSKHTQQSGCAPYSGSYPVVS